MIKVHTMMAFPFSICLTGKNIKFHEKLLETSTTSLSASVTKESQDISCAMTTALFQKLFQLSQSFYNL